ncbi:ribonuclease E inhibitor RraB [Terriglobus aquaticus]|uniref:Ribonuclease E inhibitor RraB n=1 Tax=Terriglobus aquaticus TaxID=940139 RepID=A0ABW9KNG6_9BACT|nr:ribonuclease E inhibitor RraB [Terriglobus aquaticus]
MNSKFPDDENGDVLRRMQAGGDDLQTARAVNFSVVFPTRTAAERFADTFRHSSFTVEVEEWDSQTGHNWDVTITRFMAPSHDAITAFEQELDELAAPLGGRNDGWGCFRLPAQR